MMCPATSDPIRIDSRLLDIENWLMRPRLVQVLLKQASNDVEQCHLASLASNYLSLTSTKLGIDPVGQTDKCDTFLVLGNVLNRDATPKAELVARLETALRVSNINPKARIVVSGGGQVMGVKEAEVMKRWLIAKGVTPEKILGEFNSSDTVENITMSTAILAPENVRNLCLISGPHHIERASVLLSSHLAHIDAKISVSALASNISLDQCSRENFASERFLLFKDLGRILEIWDYRERSPVPANWCGYAAVGDHHGLSQIPVCSNPSGKRLAMQVQPRRVAPCRNCSTSTPGNAARWS